MSHRRPAFDLEVPFDELSLGGYRATHPARDWQLAIHAAGTVIVRVTAEDWCISEIALDRHAPGAGGLLETGQTVLALDDPWHAIVKAAIVLHLSEHIEAKVAEARAEGEDIDFVRFGRAA